VAYLMVPQAGLIEALDDAAAAGIRNACVLSAGYAEAGEAGRTAQAELARHAAGLGMVLLGPNHLGFANLTDGVPVCSIPGLPAESGPVALLSQSGASSSAMVDFAAMANVGLSYLVTLGNEAMITAGHVLDYLVDDPGTQAIAVFMETVRDPETFRRAARRAAQVARPSWCSRRAAARCPPAPRPAHTGALVGDDRVIDAVFADLGVIRVDSIEDMLITAGAAAALGRLDRPGIGIVSISGGACDIVADRADDLGADLPELAPSTRDALAAIMPRVRAPCRTRWMFTGAAVIDPTIFTRSIETMSADPSIGVIGVVNSIPWVDTGRPYLGQMFVDAIGAGIAGGVLPDRLRQPGHAAGHRLHAGVDGAGRGAVRHPRAAPGRGGAAQRGLVVRGHPNSARRDTARSGAATRAGPAPGGSGPSTTLARCSATRASRSSRPGWPARPPKRSRRPPTSAARCRSRSSRRTSCTRAISAASCWTSRPTRRPSARPTGP